MPEITEYKISDLTTAAQVDEGDFVELSQADESVSGGRISLKATILAIANKIANGINFTSALQTTDKTIVGAINEVAQSGGGGSDVEVTPILTEGTKIATIAVDGDDVDIYGENTKEELEKLSTEKTVTGNPLTFETINGGMAKSCEVTMNPKQDLHGYEYPWAGGNGKNKIDQSTITKLLKNGEETSSGITNSDGEITVTYTYGNQGSYSLSQVVPIHSGEITISADFMVVGSSGSAQIKTNVGNNTSSISATPTPNKTITLSALNTWENKSVTYELNEQASDGITIALQASASGNQLKIKNLQVEIGSTATSYAPYENICPISGRDSVDVLNLPDSTDQPFFDGVKSGTYGFVDMGSLNWAYGNNVFNVTISNKAENYNAICPVYKSTQKSRGELLNGELGVYSTGTLNRIAIRDDNYNTAEAFKTAMSGVYLIYELAEAITSTITPEQYQALVTAFGGQTKTITLPETIYGGSFDFVSGEGSKTKIMQTFTSAEYYGTYGTDNAPLFYVNFSSALKPYDTGASPVENKLISNRYNAITTGGLDMKNGEMRTQSATAPVRVYFRDDRFTSKAEIGAYLAENPLQIVAVLATPTPFSTEPTNIELQKGTNVISTDGDSIEIKYSEMMTIDDVKSLISEAIGTVLNTEF